MRFTDGVFTEGVFANDAKTSIEAVFRHEDGTLEQVLVKVDLEDEIYKKLMTDLTIEDINNLTLNNIERQRKDFETFMFNMAQGRGLMYNADEEQRIARSKINADFFFTEPADDFAKDLLFNIKIKCFEMEKVTSSTNRDLKKALRQAKTAFDVLYITGKLVNE